MPNQVSRNVAPNATPKQFSMINEISQILRFMSIIDIPFHKFYISISTSPSIKRWQRRSKTLRSTFMSERCLVDVELMVFSIRLPSILSEVIIAKSLSELILENC